MSQEIRVAAVDDVPMGEAIVIPAAATGTSDDIALVRDEDGAFYAIDDTCTHEEASLAEGWIEDGKIECPLHAAEFCLKTGEALCLPATVDAKVHRVEVRGDDVYLLS